jgi:hypothetical protein
MLLLAGLSPEAYLYGERLTVILGLLTLTAAAAVILSCRSVISWSHRIGLKNILNYPAYQSFYKYHSYYWWAFGFIFSIHLLMGLMHIFMIPSVPDPDAYVHWYSLGSGLTAVFLAGGILFSCRMVNGPLTLLFNKNPLTNLKYKAYYKFHAYYWPAFLALAAAHYLSGFLHSGFWPH